MQKFIMRMCIWRIQAINQTKIRYLSAADKIYRITDINFAGLTIEANRIHLTITDVTENEVFPIEEFGEINIKLYNGCGIGDDVIDFTEWVDRNRKLD